jgi:hypothetical protein
MLVYKARKPITCYSIFPVEIRLISLSGKELTTYLPSCLYFNILHRYIADFIKPQRNSLKFYRFYLIGMEYAAKMINVGEIDNRNRDL